MGALLVFLFREFFSSFFFDIEFETAMFKWLKGGCPEDGLWVRSFCPSIFPKFFFDIEFKFEACHSQVANWGVVCRYLIVFFSQFVLT